MAASKEKCDKTKAVDERLKGLKNITAVTGFALNFSFGLSSSFTLNFG